MAKRYQSRIEDHCQEAGITIPSGFYRHAASRYAAIDLECSPPKLIARTWAKQEDAAYYLTNFAAGRQMRFLDFCDRRELLPDLDGKLVRRGEF